MRALAEQTRRALEGSAPRFSPMLPSDDRPLSERARARYDWVRGFFFGLGLAEASTTDLSEQARETLDAFSAITRMDLDSLQEGEDNEQALMELQEFVWVAATLLYEERRREADA
jgi:uncharacterized protein YgfB (UPF0149 family)